MFCGDEPKIGIVSAARRGQVRVDPTAPEFDPPGGLGVLGVKENY